MQAIYDLKETLCRELEEYGEKDKLDVGDLDIVDKLAHATKNLDKIIACFEEEEYSYRNGRSYRGYDRSYRASRGGNNHMSYRSRRYSMDSGMVEELREMMMDAPEHTRMKFQKLIEELERN